MSELPAENASIARHRLSKPSVPTAWVVVVVLAFAFVTLALVWASIAEVDELARAEGRVIPTGKAQVIQSAEPGVIAEIFVRTGQDVAEGDRLVRLDDTTTTASAGEVEARVNALKAQIARLRMEADGRAEAGYVCPDDLAATVPEVCANEADLLQARQNTLAQSKLVLEQRARQRRAELAEARAAKARYDDALALAQENLDLLTPLAKQNLVSRTEFIAAQRDVADTSGLREAASESITRLEAAVAEAQLQIGQADLQFRQDAANDLTLQLAALSSASEALRGASDRVSRTDIRSPVDGIVNDVRINTVGGFVNSGERLMDIVPVDDTLLIESRLKPSDIAFVRPGQKATVKFTAYDFSIFGGLDGEVVNVSADSLIDPQTRETYYVVLIGTGKSALDYHGTELRILPGMVASVEILTGRRTILQYLLKPVNKVWDEALRER